MWVAWESVVTLPTLVPCSRMMTSVSSGSSKLSQIWRVTKPESGEEKLERILKDLPEGALAQWLQGWTLVE